MIRFDLKIFFTARYAGRVSYDCRTYRGGWLDDVRHDPAAPEGDGEAGGEVGTEGPHLRPGVRHQAGPHYWRGPSPVQLVGVGRVL